MVVNPDRVLKTVAAIKAGDAKTVRMMLKAGVPATHFVTGTFATDQCSLAHYAADAGQFEVFEALIAAGASIDALQENSWCPAKSMVECACSSATPSLEIIHKILREGQPTQAHLNQSLMSACYRGVNIVEALLVAGADPNFLSSELDTPLIIAIVAKNEDVAIRLVEAGADATGSIKNKEQAPLWKKSIYDAVRMQGMNNLLALLSATSENTKGKEKPRRAHKPKNIEDCWRQIEDWIAKNATSVRLPAPFDFSNELVAHDLLTMPASEQIQLSLGHHDGTGDFALVEIPEDSSYALLSVKEALEVRNRFCVVMESERAISKSVWWSDLWWPLADNGGGDLLVVDCSDGKTSGQVLRFSHETRRAPRFKKSVLDLLQSIAEDIEWRTDSTL